MSAAWNSPPVSAKSHRHAVTRTLHFSDDEALAVDDAPEQGRHADRRSLTCTDILSPTGMKADSNIHVRWHVTGAWLEVDLGQHTGETRWVCVAE